MASGKTGAGRRSLPWYINTEKMYQTTSDRTGNAGNEQSRPEQLRRAGFLHNNSTDLSNDGMYGRAI